MDNNLVLPDRPSIHFLLPQILEALPGKPYERGAFTNDDLENAANSVQAINAKDGGRLGKGRDKEYIEWAEKYTQEKLDPNCLSGGTHAVIQEVDGKYIYHEAGGTQNLNQQGTSGSGSGSYLWL